MLEALEMSPGGTALAHHGQVFSQHWRKKGERESKHQNLGSAKLDVISVNYFQIAIANNCAVVIFTLKDKTKRWF